MKAKDKVKVASFPSANPFTTKWSGAPPNETEEEAQVRVKLMQEAVRVSKEIDQSLNEARKAIEKKKKAFKVLLLGQSESGKSSVLKNFQLAFAPKHFEEERAIWKIIVQLNLIASIRTILDALKDEYETPSVPQPTPTESSLRGPAHNLRRIRLGFSPLFFIETNLIKILSPDISDPRELCVRAGSGWKELLGHRGKRAADGQESNDRPRSQTVINNENDPTNVLSAQKGDIIALWEDQTVQDILRKRGIRLEDQSGFFMNDVARIATPEYQPTDSDIIRARIRTVGVEEHHFLVERGVDANSDFYITDVGGTRSQRASWVPYFDDVQAILFLAPLAFNQSLEEDSRVNRLEDSLTLWRDICGNKLLATANLILFFNKKDVLNATLAAGVSVKKFVPSYGNLPNDVPHVTKYFKEKFRNYHRKMSPMARPFMCYETSAIDITSMAVLLMGVRESILRQHLRDGDII
ncbi:hypothetical protein K443DRAFT_681491 [Laccaria amethystina LaAM-08-1]|uniref:G-alpha-domain-containing protein n=1 Tax=Laccaria amethystina LaAM-08-1 TaxID=1095629 RepID=A0A0C9XIT0_9AGAR|nr:hypothetical protein K443DRAFT_681491 [Laccaria amethystina LaAM-08-1]